MLEIATNDFAGNGQVSELNSFGQPWDFFGNRERFHLADPIRSRSTALLLEQLRHSRHNVVSTARRLLWATPERTLASAAT